MAVALQTHSFTDISTTDAIWYLILNQNRSVQKTIASRLAELLNEQKRNSQEMYVRQTMTRALNEAREAHAFGKTLPDACHLFDDIED